MTSSIAQETPDPKPPGEDKAALKARFMEGLQLMKEGKLEAAREKFAENVQTDTQARGSLLMAGTISNELFDPGTALKYLLPFRQLEPKHEGGLLQTIRAYSGARNRTKAEELCQELRELRPSSKRLQAMTSFERDRIQHPEGGWVSVLETFDETTPTKWQFLLMTPKREMSRMLEWTRVGDPTQGNWVFQEVKVSADGQRQADEVRTSNKEVALPTVRAWALSILLAASQPEEPTEKPSL